MKIGGRIGGASAQIGNLLKIIPILTVVVHNINCYEEAVELVNKIKDKKDMEDININLCDIGPVIGIHVGLGAIGIAYYTKNDIR